jgi:hypothetical protein
MVMAALALGASSASAEQASTGIYDNIPSALPGNLPSYGFEAYSLSEFGGEISYAVPGFTKKPVITIVMSSWACQEGSWHEGNCKTPRKKGFAVPITISIRNDSGELLSTFKHAYGMPYRPSASPICATPEFESPGSWYDAAENRCYHGIAFPLTFKLLKKDRFPEGSGIVTVSYNTTHHGPSPIGEGASCFKTPQGCFYDSLNVAMVKGAPSLGSDPTEELFLNSTWAEMYCGNASKLGTFAGTGVCPSFYEGEQPAFGVIAHKG